MNEQLHIANKEIMVQKEAIALQNDQLQALNTLKDRVFSIISHDLRSPINSLQSLLMLFKIDKEMSRDDMLHHVGRVSENVKGISGLLNNLLYWARSQMQGALKLSPKPSEVHKYIKETVALFAETAGVKGIKTTVAIEDKLPTVFIDPEILRFILRNLLNNAYKFSNENGKVNVEAQLASATQVKVFIKDDGIGMDDETMTVLFKSVVKSHKGTGAEKGTGLGLMLCQEFVKKSGGQIGVESELGNGSSFWFSIPVYDESKHTVFEEG